MDKNMLSPYVRRAMLSSMSSNHHIATRVIYDYELIYVTGGMTRLTVAGKEYLCKKGDAVLLRPGVPHEFKGTGNADFVQPHIHFDLIYNKNSTVTPISFKNRDTMTRTELTLIQPDILDIPVPCVFRPADTDSFTRLLFGIIALFDGREAGFELECKIKLLELLKLVFSQFESPSAPPRREYEDPAVSVKNYIDSNYLQLLTLNDLERQFYVNKYTLMRNFTRLYSVTPIAYYRSLRADYAKKLLLTTDCSVSSIAEELNFIDICSFSRFFRMHTGVGPREFRENQKSQ